MFNHICYDGKREAEIRSRGFDASSDFSDDDKYVAISCLSELTSDQVSRTMNIG